MGKRTFILAAANEAGAFKRAAEIIAKHNGNIVRLSYNKAVDLRTVFLDVSAYDQDLEAIQAELGSMGFFAGRLPEAEVITIKLRIRDIPGSLMPVLNILDDHSISISYLNSVRSSGDYQEFIMGILADNRSEAEPILDILGKDYHAEILEPNRSENTFDNSVFYTQLSREVKDDLGLSEEDTMEFLSESNRILQFLQKNGENSYNVFGSIREFCKFISDHKGIGFTYRTTKLELASDLEIYLIEPVCGSNICIMRFSYENSITIIDTGYAVYRDESFTAFRNLFPDWNLLKKRVIITHADVDHCGLLYYMEGNSEILMNRKSAESLARQKDGGEDYRDEKEFCHGYSMLSRIITGYTPPTLANVHYLDIGEPIALGQFTKIGYFDVGPYRFNVLEGSGGHMYGECVFICKEIGLIFTGDLLLDIKHFSEELKHFNSIAPYLMTTVDIDPPKARSIRKEMVRIISKISAETGTSFTLIGGHGPAFAIHEVLEPVSERKI
jgi:glyoxylase-like metal-dependent hydrolase (beta-lactamase superfamily II)